MNDENWIAMVARKWRPIESAPKDGSDVLLYGDADTVEIGSFVAGNNGDSDTWCDSDQEPTHWMPLPMPPNAA